MAKRLKIHDKQGNVVPYDISSASITIDAEGKTLDVKLSALVEAIAGRAKTVTFNGNTTPVGNDGNVNIGQQMQANWEESNPYYPTFIQGKPNFASVATTGSYNDLTDKPTIPEGVATDSQMSDSSDAPVKNKVIKAYVDNLISGLVNGAPQALDTLNELSAALGNDANFAATITQQLASKISGIQTHDGTPLTPQNGIVTLPESEAGAQGPKGDTGNVEITDAGDLVTILVNDLTTGGAGNILSAEMGKRLALMSGTFAQAWARSKAIPFPFCFLWNETIDGDAISKPIWHNGNSVFVDAAGAIVNVEAAAVPAAPTITGATSGSTVPKNTQITITPENGSALYYSLDGGTSYNVSDAAVTIALTTAGSVSIVAYCANNKGNSATNATLNVTVAGTAVPTFSPDGGEVSRGGSVTISVPTGGELHYRVDSGSWITASGTSVSIPITGATTIQAYNVQDGETSNTITKSFTMAALAAPTFSPNAGSLPMGGGTVTISHTDNNVDIHYTTDGSTPTTSSTQYTGTPIEVTSSMTIKAIAHDRTYGDDSAVAEASYTVPVDHKFQFKIKLTGAPDENGKITEYVPVENSGSPKYTMSVDWGDGSEVEEYTNRGFMLKGLSHQYSGSEGDEFTITLRGSAIPILCFGNQGKYNINSLVAVLDNTLDCETQFKADVDTRGGFFGCTSLTSLSANALHNNTWPVVSFQQTAITSFPSGLFSHLTKQGTVITCMSGMFYGLSADLSSALLSELKAVMGSVTIFNSMFYGYQGTAAIPNDFFDGITDETIDDVWGFSHTSGSGLTGDAAVLASVFEQKMTSASLANTSKTKYALTGGGLTNKDQVDSKWK